jgi:hypothetical protein
MLIRPEKKTSLGVEIPEVLFKETERIAHDAERLGLRYDVEGFVTKVLTRQNRKMQAQLVELEADRVGESESEADGENAVGD